MDVHPIATPSRAFFLYTLSSGSLNSVRDPVTSVVVAGFNTGLKPLTTQSLTDGAGF